MPEPANDDEFGEYRDYLMILARSQISVDLRGRIDPSDLVQETLCDAFRDQPPDQRPERSDDGLAAEKVLHDNLVDRFRQAQAGATRIVSLDSLLDQTPRTG